MTTKRGSDDYRAHGSLQHSRFAEESVIDLPDHVLLACVVVHDPAPPGAAARLAFS